MTRPTLVAGAVLALALLAGCGSTSSSGGEAAAPASSAAAPTDATQTDFCGLEKVMSDKLNAVGASPTDQEKVDALHSVGDEFLKVGTPAGIPADARQGFELTIKTLEDVQVADMANKSFDPTKDFTADEKAALTAFDAYAAKTCGG